MSSKVNPTDIILYEFNIPQISQYKSRVGIKNNKNKYAHDRPRLNIVFDLLLKLYNNNDCSDCFVIIRTGIINMFNTNYILAYN